MTIHSPLLTDLYQLTMGCGYYELGMAEQEAVFQLFYRRNPFQGHYAVACGLNSIIDYVQHWHFSDDDIRYLQTLTGTQQQPLLTNNFLHYLKNLKFSCDIDAIPEGNVVFPHEPLLRIKGPIIQCQLLETLFVNLINFATLIATKAARVCQAAQGDPVIEFGLRRTQGPDGGMTATRAAIIGGCDATSNTLAGQLDNIPVRGTHAHSWIMAFPDELTAFESYAKVMPHNAIFLVDTYHTINGVKNAIKIGKKLRESGHDLQGIRLDSGDLAKLSIESRKLLDAAGFTKTIIFASGDLEEHMITELKNQGAKIDAWGVGTKMVTAYDQPSLDAAYKLAAIKDAHGDWQYRIKFSDTPAKTTNPGIQQVRRYFNNQHFVKDIIYDETIGITADINQPTTHYQDLLTPIFRDGQCVYQSPTVLEQRKFCKAQVAQFINSNQATYEASLEEHLQAIKNKLIKENGSAPV